MKVKKEKEMEVTRIAIRNILFAKGGSNQVSLQNPADFDSDGRITKEYLRYVVTTAAGADPNDQDWKFISAQANELLRILQNVGETTSVKYMGECFYKLPKNLYKLGIDCDTAGNGNGVVSSKEANDGLKKAKEDEKKKYNDLISELKKLNCENEEPQG